MFVFKSNWSASRADIEGGDKLWTNAKCKAEVKVFTCTAPVLSGRWGQGPACHQRSGKSWSLQKRMWPPHGCHANSLSLISHERGRGQGLGNCRRWQLNNKNLHAKDGQLSVWALHLVVMGFQVFVKETKVILLSWLSHLFPFKSPSCVHSHRHLVKTSLVSSAAAVVQRWPGEGVMHQRSQCLMHKKFPHAALVSLHAWVWAHVLHRPGETQRQRLGGKRGQAEGQMVSLMVAEIKEGIRGLQGVRSDGNYSK